jgi:hypothetical protein
MRHGVDRHSGERRARLGAIGGNHLSELGHQFGRNDQLRYHRPCRQGCSRQEAAERHAEARRRARSLRFDYAETLELANRPTGEVLKRLEELISGGLVEDAGARVELAMSTEPLVGGENWWKILGQLRLLIFLSCHDRAPGLLSCGSCCRAF